MHRFPIDNLIKLDRSPAVAAHLSHFSPFGGGGAHRERQANLILYVFALKLRM